MNRKTMLVLVTMVLFWSGALWAGSSTPLTTLGTHEVSTPVGDEKAIAEKTAQAEKTLEALTALIEKYTKLLEELIKKQSAKVAKPAADKEKVTIGTVHVNTWLNVRTGPNDTIIGQLHNNDKVEIIGNSGGWYKIRWNGKIAYCFAEYVSTGNKSVADDNKDDKGTVTPPANVGDMQKRIVQEAHKLVGNTHFPYAAATNGGRLGCAQVVSTALKAAGVLPGVLLGVLDVMSQLKSRGWKVVSAPPFRAGDVITWKTYDRNGDGRNDDDTHIGIILTNGNSAQAMSNSSSARMPRINSATYMPVSHVLRKA